MFQLGHVFSDMDSVNVGRFSIPGYVFAFQLGHVFSDMDSLVRKYDDGSIQKVSHGKLIFSVDRSGFPSVTCEPLPGLMGVSIGPRLFRHG